MPRIARIIAPHYPHHITQRAKTAPGRRKIAVKVVDIFGNDTMTIMEVNV